MKLPWWGVEGGPRPVPEEPDPPSNPRQEEVNVFSQGAHRCWVLMGGQASRRKGGHLPSIRHLVISGTEPQGETTMSASAFTQRVPASEKVLAREGGGSKSTAEAAP